MDDQSPVKSPETLARERISADPAICGGRPCVRGTRIRVTDILQLLAAGASRAEIVEDHPNVTDDDITAVLAFAAESYDHPIILAPAGR
jgi:uncharacterized protein (DUF433 family)